MALMNAWLYAARLRTLPLAAACILLGSALARSAHLFKAPVFWLSLTTALCLQILSNLANDLGDFLKGTDSAGRVGQKRALQSGLLSPAQMKKGIIINVLLCLALGSALIVQSFPNGVSPAFILFILIGAAAVAAALKYTLGKNPFGYAGFGDIAVFVFFGLVGVGGTAFLHGMTLEPNLIFPAMAMGCLSAGVLNINNMRDIESDIRAGKRTLAVRLGRTGSKAYHGALLLLAWVATAFFLPAPVRATVLVILGLVFLLFFLRVLTITDSVKMDPMLKVQSLIALLYALITGAALNMP